MPYYMHELNPDYNPATGMLHHMTTDELKQLLNDDDRLESMIKDLQQVKNAETERETLLTTNKSLAEYNFSQKPILNELQNKVAEQINEMKTLKESVEEKKITLDDLTRQMSLDTTLALLQASAAESEEESEAISENFLSGEIQIEIFLESFLNKRKLTHLRRLKAEKMTELLNHSRAGHNFSPLPTRVTPQGLSNNPPYPSAFPPFMPTCQNYPSMMPSQGELPYFR